MLTLNKERVFIKILIWICLNYIKNVYSKKIPSEKVLKRWGEQFSWLDITNNKTLIWKIWCSQEDKLRSMPHFSISFISGNSTYRLSALKDHENSACHQHAIRKKQHEEAVAIGKSLPSRKIQCRPLTSE